VEFTGIERLEETAKTKDESWLESLTGAQLQILKDARENGLLKAFEVAYRRSNATPVTSQIAMEKVFLNFLKSQRPKALPDFALRYFAKLYPGTTISCLGSNSVATIISNNMIVQICPYEVLFGASLTKGNGKTIKIKESTPERLEEWIKTKFGYIAKKGLFADEMRKHSIGEFANIRL